MDVNFTYARLARGKIFAFETSAYAIFRKYVGYGDATPLSNRRCIGKLREICVFSYIKKNSNTE